VALVIAPSIAIDIHNTTPANGTEITVEGTNDSAKGTKEIKVQMIKQDDGTFKAVVTTTTTINGEVKSDEQIFIGTEEEVKAQINKFKEADATAMGCANCKGAKELCAECKAKATKTSMTKSCCDGKMEASCATNKTTEKKA